MYGPPPQCILCKHWESPLARTDEDSAGAKPTQVCSAYPLPDGIPAEIWTNQVDHRVPYEDDGGVTWEAAEGVTGFPEWAMASAT